MWHCAWDGECHVDARWHLRRRAAFNDSVGCVGLREGLFGLMFCLACLGFSFMSIIGLIVCSSSY